MLFAGFKLSLKIHSTTIDKLVYGYLVLFLFYSVVGFIQGYAVRDILEDLYPMLVFGMLYVLWRSWKPETLLYVWQFVVVAGVVAAFKVLLVGLLPVEAGWDSVWQAAKEPLPLGSFNRIILRGGDIFISISLVCFLLDVLRKGQSSVWKKMTLIILCLLAVFISLSRSSFLADFVAILSCMMFFYSWFSRKKMMSLMVALGVVIIAVLPFVNTISLAISIFEARTDAFDNNNISVSFRENENELVRETASDAFYLGNGLGAFFYLPLSGSEKLDGRSIYAHNFNYWLLLKVGLPGLVLFYSILILSIKNYLNVLRNSLKDEMNFRWMTLFAAGILVWTISILANKFSTLSGSVFLALFVAGSTIAKSSYEARH